jgi:hypothetical protein
MIAFDFDHFLQNVSFASLLVLLLFHWGRNFLFHPIIGRLGMWIANVALTFFFWPMGDGGPFPAQQFV